METANVFLENVKLISAKTFAIKPKKNKAPRPSEPIIEQSSSEEAEEAVELQQPQVSPVDIELATPVIDTSSGVPHRTEKQL